QGKLKEAQSASRQLTGTYPDYAHGWYTASLLALRLKNPETAMAAIDRALTLRPATTPWLLHRATCMVQLGQDSEVRGMLLKMSASPPQHVEDCSALAGLLSQLELMNEAYAIYLRASELEPGNGTHYFNLATAQRSLGDLGAARGNMAKAIQLDPGDYDAWYAQSELRDPNATDNHIGALENLLRSGIKKPSGKVQVLYSLARELEDTGNTEKSFHYLQQGAALRRQHLSYQPESDLHTMARLREIFSAGMFPDDSLVTGHSPPIFVLGLPRTGTTLVERILGAHSKVQAAGELNDFPREMMRAVRELAHSADNAITTPSKNDMLALTGRLNFQKLGDAYLQSTRARAHGCAHFVDKLPLNFLYTGLIHLALPGAKIIHVQRNPMDCCYAIYKTLFRDAYPFSYNLQELGDYYLAYRELMAHWNSVLPGMIHTVQYEELVADLELQSRHLLSHCNLPWEQQCLAFEKSQASTSTASAVQVRRGLYNSSVGKWRHYEGQLQPLVEKLSAAGVNTQD
ncbi:MAG: tetratricopeptide repeat protein, partial [Halieaceae bacterium]|nr:tetratricopeptide repeat protein [Halieaceae bacterium]